MEEVAIQELRRLVDKLRTIKSQWEGKNEKEAPIDVFLIQTAKEDMADTDLYLCSLCGKNISICRYNVLVDPVSHNIVEVDLNDVDIEYEGVVYDCNDVLSSNFWESMYVLA